MGLPFFDSCVRVNQNPLSGNYTTWGSFNPLQLLSNGIQATVNSTANASYINSISLNSDCEMGATIQTSLLGDVDLCLRFDTGAANGYLLDITSTGWSFYKVVASSQTIIGATQSRATSIGDVFKFRIVGNTLYCIINGTQQGYTQTDSTFASAGKAGPLLDATGDSINNIWADNYPNSKRTVLGSTIGGKTNLVAY